MKKHKKFTKAFSKVNKQKIYNDLKIRIFVITPVVLFLAVFLRMEQISINAGFPVSEDRSPIQKIQVVATAYSSDVGQTDNSPCIPADGYNLCDHYEKYGEGNTIAANFLPLGTQVRLPEVFGNKVFIVHDRMNKRYGRGRIDVWMPTREEAKKFGVKYMELEMYGGGKWRLVSR